jgi:hypothetical protein
MTKKRNSSYLNKNIILIGLLVIILLIWVGFYFNGITGNVALANYSDTNYSAPYSLSNPSDYVFKISSDSLVAVNNLVNLTADVSLKDGYIYQKGYVYNKRTFKWEVFNFDESPVENSYWIRDFASKDLVINVSNNVKNSSETYIVAYACQKVNKVWQCGCQSSDETNCKRWMLHTFNVSNITVSPDINCTSNANCSMTNGTCDLARGFCVSKILFPLGTPENPFKITIWENLSNIKNNLTASYILMNNLDESSEGYSDYAGPSANTGAGWQPLGNNTTQFEGNFDGNGKTISGLYINRLALDLVGLFGNSTGNISNIGLDGVNVTGRNFVGGLVGWQKSNTIINSHLIGNLSGTNYIGGLIGVQESMMINNSYVTVNIKANNGIGGLIGYSYNSTILNSYSTGNIMAKNFTGGLAGFQEETAIINNSYSTVDIIGNNTVGGLVSQQFSSSIISNSYATGNLIGSGNIGGLVGVVNPTVLIYRSYATGNVTTATGSSVGGLIGSLWGNISNSYATGNVTGNTKGYIGGLVGYFDSGLISNSYSTGKVVGSVMNIGGLIGASLSSKVYNSSWDMNTSGRAYSTGGAGVIGKNTTQMKTLATFSDVGWDFTNIWAIDPNKNNGYPYLGWQAL